MAARQSNQPSTPNLYDASAWTLAHDAWLRRQRLERRSLALAFDKCYGAVLQTNVVTQIRNGLREDSVYLAGAGDVAACVLRSFECLYANGAASYFEAVVGALDALVERGYHLPRTTPCAHSARRRVLWPARMPTSMRLSPPTRSELSQRRRSQLRNSGTGYS